MLKTNKSLSKRLKLTKNGKIKARKPGHCHLNAKQKRSKQLKQKGMFDFQVSMQTLKKYLPYS